MAKNCVPCFSWPLYSLRWTRGSSKGYLRLFQRNTYTSFISTFGAVYVLAFMAMQLVRTVLWWRYRPYSLPSGLLPKVTVLIPAYNEGAMVEKTLYSVAAADYPKDRLEIICIDDGSRDDTWNYIQRARQRYPQLIQAIRFPEKPGQTGSPLCRLSPGHAGTILSPWIRTASLNRHPQTDSGAPAANPKIGAVAGNVKVYNRTANILTRMVWVRFVSPLTFSGPPSPCTASCFAPPGLCPLIGGRPLCPSWTNGANKPFWACAAPSARTGHSPTWCCAKVTTPYISAALWSTPPCPRTTVACPACSSGGTAAIFANPWSSYPTCSAATGPGVGCLPILDFVVRELEFPMTAIFFPLMLASFLCCPILIVKFVSGMALVSFLLTIYYLQQERDTDFIYGIVYSFYAVLFLRWVRPYALSHLAGRPLVDAVAGAEDFFRGN